MAVILTGYVTMYVTTTDRNRGRLVEAWSAYMGAAAGNIVAIDLYWRWMIAAQAFRIPDRWTDSSEFNRLATRLEDAATAFEAALTRVLMLEHDEFRRKSLKGMKSIVDETKPFKTQDDLDHFVTSYKATLATLAENIQKPLSGPFSRMDE